MHEVIALWIESDVELSCSNLMILQVFESVCVGGREVFLENIVLCKRWLKCGAMLGFKA